MRLNAPESRQAGCCARRVRSLVSTCLVAVAAVLLVVPPGAIAGNPLRRSGAATTPAPSSAALTAGSARSSLMAQEAASPLLRALDAIKRAQAAQAAAAAAAQAAASNVPNGIQPGGLVIDPNLSLAPSNISYPTVTAQGDRTEVTLTQNQQRAIVNWSSFNVGKKTDLYFDQTAGGSDAKSWVVLNRVTGSGKSQVLGSIKAEGQVYILNQNGILFGGSSQVNVGTLVLSGLDLPTVGSGSASVQVTDYAKWRNALLDPAVTDLSKLPLTFSLAPGSDGSVKIEAGAQLSTATGGRVVILGSSVTNSGSIVVPSGQVLLAAGQAITLSQSSDSRGVSLSGGELSLGDAAGGYSPSLVTNDGLISAPLGLVGLYAGTVNQNGTITLTTGAQVQGVLELGHSSDKFTYNCENVRCTASFGPGSVTQILPDIGGQKVVGSGATFTTGAIKATGDVINVLDGASLYAPAGTISLLAQMTSISTPTVTDPTLPGYDQSLVDDSQINVASNARIDVSGLAGVQVAMEQNTIQAQMRANELRDNPVLRNSPLRGQTVYFDVRQGSTLVDGSGVANLGGYLNLLKRDVSQFMTSGGTITLNAHQVTASQGSTIDLSGGSLQYLPGYVKHTILIDAAGNRKPIEAAQAGVKYVGTDGDFVVDHSRWGVSQRYSSALSRAVAQYEPGYVQGGNAGTLNIGAKDPGWWIAATGGGNPYPPNPSATMAPPVLDGTILARTTIGPHQRELPSGRVDPLDLTTNWKYQPRGGTLNLTRAPDVVFVGPGTSTPIPDNKLALSSTWFGAAHDSSAAPERGALGFTTLNISAGSDPDKFAGGADDDTGNVERASGGNLIIPARVVLDLGDGGSFSFSGKSAEILGGIVAAGGTVSLTALQKNGASDAGTAVHLGAGGLIDVAGRYTNDFVDGAGGPYRALSGGSVAITSVHVQLEPLSVIDASGGARLDVKGSALTAGSGGAIRLNVGMPPKPGPGSADPNPGTLRLEGELRAYALTPGDGLPSLGGSLTIATGSDVRVGGSAAPPDGFSADFFQRGGFSSYTIIGGRGLEVAGDTTISPTSQSMALPSSRAAGLATGVRLDDVLPLALSGEHSTSLTLSTQFPPTFYSADPNRSGTGGHYDLRLETGAAIQMAPGSTVQLITNGNLVLGEGTIIKADGGTLVLSGRDIQLLGGSQLVAAGYSQTIRGANKTDTPVSDVQAGGNVSLSATSSIEMASTAQIDVHGVSGTADVSAGPGSGTRYQERSVDGDAGSITISAPSGIVQGVLNLHEGAAATGGSSLTITTGGLGALSVFDSSGNGVPGSLNVAASTINGSDAADVTLRVITIGDDSPEPRDQRYSIGFAGAVSLQARRSLRLMAPYLGWSSSPEGAATADPTVVLSSDYVALGEEFAPLLTTYAPDPVAHGTLHVSAKLIDVSGRLVLSGTPALNAFHTVTLGDPGNPGDARSTGDIRLSDPVVSAGNFGVAGLSASGPLEFDCAQLYVASRGQAATSGASSIERLADDPGFLVHSDTSITVKRSTGGAAPVPLSFGERLTLDAPDITQDGVVRAPLGQIRLQATGSVTLGAGSVTSVSLEDPNALVPFGPVQSGGVFGIATNGYSQPGQAPSKSVTLSAPNVKVSGAEGGKPAATIDVSGGGDLLGYQFVSGNGGTNDFLDSGYAILPSAVGSGPAPLGGTAALADASLAPRQSIYLQGVPGLKDGYYTLLPGHYALLPGAFFIQPKGGAFASASRAVARGDGSMLASGYETYGDAPIANPVWSRFVVTPRGVLDQFGEYETFSFNKVAAQRASEAGLGVRLPNDAGNLAIQATSTLTLDGVGKFAPGPGGLLGNLDISAPRIAVLGGSAAADSSGAYDSYVKLDVDALQRFGAGSILLGGLRTSTPTGTVVAVDATQITVDTGGATWTAPEIVLAARADPSSPGSQAAAVSIKDGSSLRAELSGTQAASFDPSTLIFADAASADGALLRLSAGVRVGVVRNLSGTATPTGVLSVGSATLSAQGSLGLDASSTVGLASSAVLSSSQLDLASGTVNLGQAPAGAPGTTLSSDMLARLGSSDLLIRGYSAVQLYGDLALGTRDATSGAASLANLTFDTPLLVGVADATGQAPSAAITVGQLTLRNGGAAQSAGGTAAGTLTLDADRLVLGPGAVQLGYAALTGKAGTVAVQGAGSLASKGSLALQTAQVRAGSGAAYAIDFDDGVQLASGTGTPVDPKTVGLGGALSISSARGVTIDTAVVLPAGTLQVEASSGVQVGQHASLDVSGRMIDFSTDPNDPVRRFAPGGVIRLTASAGDVNVDAGATLDVSSGSALGGDAGTIAITAGPQSNVSILGTLQGAGGTGADRGGSFLLDAGSADGLPALLSGLAASGIDESVSVRLRGSQGIAIASGQTVKAHTVTLRSDGGQVSVAGTIDASGTSGISGRPDGGNVQLIGYAAAGQDAVTVSGTVDAHAGDAAPAGAFDPVNPQVLLVANGAGQVDIGANAVIDVSPGHDAKGDLLAGGMLTLRAPRVGSDVAIAPIAGTVRGARAVVVQGIDHELVSDTTGLSGLVTAGASWLTGVVQGGAASRLTSDASLRSRLQFGAGIVLESTSDDLSVTSLDVHGQLGAGYLGFVASRDITLNGAVLSDGFGSNGALFTTPSSSSSYSFEAGRDITLTNATVRTGTGAISMSAGGNLTFADNRSVVYTAGRATTPRAAFTGRTADAAGDALYSPTDGGDVSITVGGDIAGRLADQSTSAWLFRYGGGNGLEPSQASWSILYANFQQGVGALGGGNVRVNAGGAIQELQVSIPTTGYTITAPGAEPQGSDLVVNGGGNLQLAAGGDIVGGLYVLGRGRAEVGAGGSILPSSTTLFTPRKTWDSPSTGPKRGAGLLLGLMDATAEVTAARSISVEGVFDPMMQGQVAANLLGGTGAGFAGYTNRTFFRAVSLAGDVHYTANAWASVDLTLTPTSAYRVTMSGTSGLNAAFRAAPPTLELGSLGGSVFVDNSVGSFANKSPFFLAPAPTGNLMLLAGEDVHIGTTLTMSDVDPGGWHGALAAFSLLGDLTVAADGSPVSVLPTFGASSGSSPLHADDAEPARIYALAGSVCAGLSGACSPGTNQGTKVQVPKPMQVVAGKDVISGQYWPQNNRPGDVSLIEAGRDLVQLNATFTAVGTAVLQAGRDIDLVQQANATRNDNPIGGAIYGIGPWKSVWHPDDRNIPDSNSALPDAGTSLMLLAGMANGADWDGFASIYLDPANSKGVPKTYLGELAAFMKKVTGKDYGSPTDLVSAFSRLKLVQREVFLEQVYMSELKQTGIAYNGDPGTPGYHSYARGTNAVDRLFPGDRARIDPSQRGNILLNAKPVETQFDAGIDALAPYGHIDIGSAVAPDGPHTGATGIATRRGGSIQLMADGDISLYTSRVFTLGGGDITMWSSDGNINAGAGSKTSVLQPPLQYSMDANGAVSVVSFGLSTGAGIGVLDAFGTATDRPKSNLVLVAPKGEVNAGDAGIRVVGDVFIAAQTVVGVENISFSGSSAGVPKVDVPNIAALTSAGQTAAQTSSSADHPPTDVLPKQAPDLPSIITVEPEGYEVTDTPAAPGDADDRKKKAHGAP